jgi:hypothetical protein
MSVARPNVWASRFCAARLKFGSSELFRAVHQRPDARLAALDQLFRLVQRLVLLQHVLGGLALRADLVEIGLGFLGAVFLSRAAQKLLHRIEAALQLCPAAFDGRTLLPARGMIGRDLLLDGRVVRAGKPTVQLVLHRLHHAVGDRHVRLGLGGDDVFDRGVCGQDLALELGRPADRLGLRLELGAELVE